MRVGGRKGRVGSRLGWLVMVYGVGGLKKM